MEEKRLEFIDDEKHEQYMREIFKADERTDHKGILPAKDRIKQYKTKAIRRNIQWPYGITIHSSQDIKGIKTRDNNKMRPVTAAASNFGLSDAPTAFTRG